jgi:phosphate-selective porin
MKAPHAAMAMALTTVMSLAVGRAVAQTPAVDTGAASHLDLSAAQQWTIFQSISNTAKNNAAPTGFRPAVGAVEPPSIELSAVPRTIVELVPQTKGLEAAQVEGQVVLVDPKAKQVVAVISPERP